MKQLIILFILLSGWSSAQTNVQLKNALVIGQMDKPEDRYSIEINLVELLASHSLVAKPSLNYVKVGQDSRILAEDSLRTLIASHGIDTYVIVSVRGFDRKFKSSTQKSLTETLEAGNLFRLYRDGAVSVSFEFTFYRNGQYVGNDIVKCGNISDRDSVVKRLRKKTNKRLVKKWMK